MKPHPAKRSRFYLAAAFVSAAFLVACEDEGLHPAPPGFVPTECVGQTCDPGGGAALDGGFLVPDSGVPTTHPDAAPVESDTGAEPAPDAGFVFADASEPPPPPDSGPPDSGVVVTPDAGFPVDAGPPPEFLNLAGTHRTLYKFDLSRYLFGLPTLAGPIDTLAQIVQGNVDTGFPPLDLLIQNIVQQYVPPWLVTVVRVLNSLANFFNEVEARGSMNIAQDRPIGVTSGLRANETWSQLTVYIIDNCPRGRQDPNYPACARQNIPIASPANVGPLTIGVDVRPFTGVLQAGRPQADFRFTNREVEMEVTKLIRVVLDLALNLISNGQIPSLMVALDRLIDCPGLEVRAEQIALDFGLPPIAARAAASSVRSACDREKMRVIDAVINGVNGIGITWETLQFDQLGHAVDTNGNGRPETLQVLTRPDTIDGRFRAVGSAHLGGVWEGINTNP